MLRNSRNVVGVITYAVPISAVKNISSTRSRQNSNSCCEDFERQHDAIVFPLLDVCRYQRRHLPRPTRFHYVRIYVESIPRCRRAHRSNRMRKRMESGDGLLIARSCGADEMISEKKMMMLDEPIFCQRESPPNAISVPRRAESLKRSLRWDQLLLAQSPIDALCIECVLASLLDGVGQLF